MRDTLNHLSIQGAALDNTVGIAIAEGMNRIGADMGLEPLAWEIHTTGGAAIEGVPIEGTGDAMMICLAWAHALDLEEYLFNTGEGTRTWYAAGGEWHIEITTAPRK